MLDVIQPVTMLNVLEFDGLIAIESGVAHTTTRFQRTMAASRAARRARREKRNADLRETVAQAMHGLYSSYLSEEEMQRLVDAMMPIASADTQPRGR